ncbi:MAG TPA: hypothetical protein PKY88_07850 [Anaerohalosphaeraceae bacterium]|nr:hypothetical protein [Anaerohalosphaeraceae bacterium]
MKKDPKTNVSKLADEEICRLLMLGLEGKDTAPTEKPTDRRAGLPSDDPGPRTLQISPPDES